MTDIKFAKKDFTKLDGLNLKLTWSVATWWQPKDKDILYIMFDERFKAYGLVEKDWIDTTIHELVEADIAKTLFDEGICRHCDGFRKEWVHPVQTLCVHYYEGARRALCHQLTNYCLNQSD